MPNDLDFPKRLLAVALSAAFPAHGVAQTAARVDFVSGNVTASAPGGGSRPLSRGAEVRVGETVSTQNGRAQMRFTDGAFVSLQPQTDFKIENYVFEGRGSQNESAIMSLLKGGMRTITGLIGRTNREGYRVQTATATVGIRGTEYSISYDEGGSVTMHVAGGAIAVTNQTGTTMVPGGRSVSVGGQNSTPQTVNEKPFLSPSGSTPVAVAVQTNVVQDAQPPAQTILTGLVPNAGIAEVKNEPYSYPRAWGPLALSYSTAATLNGAGALTSWSSTDIVNSTTQNYSSGSAAVQSAGNDGVIAWGGWSGGSAAYTATGAYSYSSAIDLTNSSPWFYVVGAPVPAMPTAGSAVYNMIGALAGCAPGFCSSASVVGAQLQVDFGSLAGTHVATLNINGTLDEFRGTLQLSGSSFYAGGFSRAADPLGRYFYGEGIFAGNNASRAGMAFSVEGSSTAGYGNVANGVIAYAQAGASGASMFSSMWDANPTLKTGASTTLFYGPELAGTYHGSSAPDIQPGSVLASQNVQIGPSGGVYAFEGNSYNGFQLTNGTSSVQGAGNDGIIAWGRWVGGRDSEGRDLYSLGSGPFHYVVGLPATALPTSGIYEFSQIGHTASCATICSTASVDSKLTVDYAAMTGNLDVSVKLDNAAPYSNPLIGVYVSGSRLSASGSVSQGVSGPSLTFEGRGFLAGNQSSNATARAGMAYSVAGTTSLGTGSVNGVIAYGNRVGIPPLLVVAPPTLAPPPQ